MQNNIKILHHCQQKIWGCPSSGTTEHNPNRSRTVKNTIIIQQKEKAQKENKSLFLDFYTSWCGYCKKMDRSTFVNSSVVNTMNANYVALKLILIQSDNRLILVGSMLSI